jgi:hypothetical protein
MAKKRTEAQEAKRFGLILAIGLGAIGGWMLYRGRELAPWICIGIGSFALVCSTILPGVWLRLFRLWMKLAEGLSFVMTRVILSVFFFLILTPLGLVMRLIGKRPLDLKYKDGKSTYWIDKPEGEYTLERYRRIY